MCGWGHQCNVKLAHEPPTSLVRILQLCCEGKMSQEGHRTAEEPDHMFACSRSVTLPCFQMITIVNLRTLVSMTFWELRLNWIEEQKWPSAWPNFFSVSFPHSAWGPGKLLAIKPEGRFPIWSCKVPLFISLIQSKRQLWRSEPHDL